MSQTEVSVGCTIFPRPSFPCQLSIKSISQLPVATHSFCQEETSHYFFFLISWRLITLQYCSGFCHTLTWISLGYTCIPHPDPPSHLPLHLRPVTFKNSPDELWPTEDNPPFLKSAWPYSITLSQEHGFPGAASGKESTYQRRRNGFNLWSEKIPQDEEQLSLCAAVGSRTREPWLLKPMCIRVHALQREATAIRSPNTLTRRVAPASCN